MPGRSHVLLRYLNYFLSREESIYRFLLSYISIAVYILQHDIDLFALGFRFY